MRSFLPLLLAAAWLAPIAPAQSAARLLLDIHPGGGNELSANPTDAVDLGGVVLYAATTRYGNELHRSDLTTQGTYLLKDIWPGAKSSNPRNLTKVGNCVFFTAERPNEGRELWKTDGTADGTKLIKDIAAGPRTSLIGWLISHNGKLWFTADDRIHGPELWFSDGTEIGTKMFDIVQGRIGSRPSFLCSTPAGVYFNGITLAGAELMRATQAGGAQLIFDATGALDPTHITAFKNGVIFNGRGANGREPHFSNGTSTGTGQLRDVFSGRNSSEPQWFTPMNGICLFSASDTDEGIQDLWRTDGTPGGTTKVKQLAAGGSRCEELVVMNGVCYFRARIDGFGIELARSDGTSSGTVLVRDANPGAAHSNPRELVVFQNNLLVYTCEGTTNDAEVWKSNGTSAGTQRAADVRPGAIGSSPRGYLQCGALLWFTADDGVNGRECHRGNGTVTVTALVKNERAPRGDSKPCEFTPFKGRTYFSAENPATGRELWRSDGNSAAPIDLWQNGSTDPKELTVFGDRMFFSGRDPQVGRELLWTDGNGNTGVFQDLLPGPGSSSPRELTVAGDKLFFVCDDPGSGAELWVTGGVPGDARQVKDIRKPGSSSPRELTAVDDILFFAATDGRGAEVWRSDGSEDGTRIVGDLRPGALGSNPTDFVAFADGVCVAGNNGTNGIEPYYVTVNGITMISDLYPGSTGSRPDQFAAAGDKLFFTATTPTQGRELFVYDPVTGARIVADIEPGVGSPIILDVCAAGTQAFFLCDAGDNGEELWVSDGDDARLVDDILPGPGSGLLRRTLQPLGDLVVCAASDGDDGLQLFCSDGTPDGTKPIGKIGPRVGVGAAAITKPGWKETTIYISCDTESSGIEPWIISLRFSGTPFVNSYGQGCAGSNLKSPKLLPSGTPRIGKTFSLRLFDATPQRPATLFASTTPARAKVAACDILLGLPLVQFAGGTTTQLGNLDMDLSLPNEPTLLGAEVYGQTFVVDRGGQMNGLGAVSNGTRMLIGR